MAAERNRFVRQTRLALRDRDEAALVPVHATTLVDEIVARLIDYVLANDLKPGDPLPPQRDLADRLVVSRPVLRQAIRQLERDGILRVRHGSGMWLETVPVAAAPDALRPEPHAVAAMADAPFSHQSALAVLEARMVIDVELAAFAAERATLADIAELENALGKIRAASQRGRPTVAATSRFHQLLALSAHSPVLAGFYAELTKPMMAGGLRIETALPDVLHREEANHRTLLDAILSRDPNVAREAMRKHLSKAHHWEKLVARLRQGRDEERDAADAREAAADLAAR
jgi:GntR family transcriptional repressor for pyruvate dehydrogenase complex